MNLVLTPLKLVFGLVGICWMFLAGILYVTALPPGWPNYHLWGPITLHAPYAGAVGVWKGRYDLRIAQDAAAAGAAQVVYTNFIRQQAELNREIDAKLTSELAQHQKAHDVIHDTITRWLTPAVDARYPLPWSLVLLHDAAATGADPTATGDLPAGQSLEAPSTVKASDLAGVFNDNYKECRDDAAELNGALDYIDKLLADYNGMRGQLTAAQAKAIAGAK